MDKRMIWRLLLPAGTNRR